MPFTFHVPTKPYSAIDAINRAYAATGSCRMACATQGADFNGHANRLYSNAYRHYFVGEYQWAGRNVWFRGTNLADGISAALRAYDSQGKGASLTVEVENMADAALCLANPRLVEGEEDVRTAPWWTWQHEHAHDYILDERAWGGISVKLFTDAASYDEYRAAVSAELAKRRRCSVCN